MSPYFAYQSHGNKVAEKVTNCTHLYYMLNAVLLFERNTMLNNGVPKHLVLKIKENCPLS